MLGAHMCVQDACESSFVTFDITMTGFDSRTLRLLVGVLECISALVCAKMDAECACVRRGRMGKPIWPFEVTLIWLDPCLLRVLVNAFECMLALVCEDGRWVHLCASRMHGKKDHLSILKS